MTDGIVLAVLISAFIVAVATHRRRSTGRRGKASTVSLVVDGGVITRTLVDGRVESADLATIASVELVCTPVTTADGAKAFLILADGADAGCLVPLGVDLDDEVLVELTRLPGFRIERLSAGRDQRPPHREVIWERSAP